MVIIRDICPDSLQTLIMNQSNHLTDYKTTKEYITQQLALKRDNNKKKEINWFEQILNDYQIDEKDEDSTGCFPCYGQEDSDDSKWNDAEFKTELHQFIKGFKGSKGGGKGAKGGKGGFQGQCNHCGKYGHRKSDCRVLTQEMWGGKGDSKGDSKGGFGKGDGKGFKGNQGKGGWQGGYQNQGKGGGIPTSR